MIKKENSKKRNKKVKIGYDEVKIKCRIKTRLSSKVYLLNFRGDQSRWSPLDPPLTQIFAPLYFMRLLQYCREQE